MSSFDIFDLDLSDADLAEIFGSEEDYDPWTQPTEDFGKVLDSLPNPW